MSNNTFNNVIVDLLTNVYFDGQVTSRNITLSDGTKKTLGLMLPGEYEFATEVNELMEINSGQLEVMLPDSSEWQTISAGMSFKVAGAASFKVKVHSITDYCCSYDHSN